MHFGSKDHGYINTKNMAIKYEGKTVILQHKTRVLHTKLLSLKKRQDGAVKTATNQNGYTGPK